MNMSMRALCLLICSLLGVGCSSQPRKHLSPPVTGYNHTSAAINWFRVNGDGGPNLGPHKGGGKFNCCTTVPSKWHPGMTATVEWEKDPEPFAYANWPPLGTDGYRAAYKQHSAKYIRHRATVEIPPYRGVGSMNIHFLPCDQVRIAVNGVLPGRPSYPHNEELNMEEPRICPD